MARYVREINSHWFPVDSDETELRETLGQVEGLIYKGLEDDESKRIRFSRMNSSILMSLPVVRVGFKDENVSRVDMITDTLGTSVCLWISGSCARRFRSGELRIEKKFMRKI